MLGNLAMMNVHDTLNELMNDANYLLIALILVALAGVYFLLHTM